MTYLGQGSCIDVEEQFLSHCSSKDNMAWSRSVDECENRGLQLCSEEQYMKAYTDESVVTQNSRSNAYTSTDCDDNNQFRMMDGHYGDVYCYSKSSGCDSNRYYRCCSTGKYTFFHRFPQFFTFLL